MELKRKYGYLRDVDAPGGGGNSAGGEAFVAKPKDVPEVEANLVSSEVEGMKDIHMPVIDLDLPCELLESSTPGHFHLYINHPITWSHYERVLRALTEAGIVQEGFYNSALAKRASHVRKPGHMKVPVTTEPF